MTATPVDLELVRQLASLLDDKGLTELEIASGDFQIRMAKGHAPVVTGYAPAPVAPPAASPPAAAPPAATAPTAIGSSPAADPAGLVASPMVGTAYLSPQPGAPVFVREGDRVRTGQTLLIIEAMKVMNPLPSPRDGTVTRIIVRDGQPVEFGEHLIVVE
jgi:acetyl-CoA carboxylase biotin carboxyl carrier protein